MWGEWTSCQIENGNGNQQRNRTFIYDCISMNKPVTVVTKPVVTEQMKNLMTSVNITSINQTTGYNFEKRICGK